PPFLIGYFSINFLRISVGIKIQICFLLRSFFGHEISDYQCGFKGMIKDDLSDLLLSVEDSVYFFDTELIIKAIRAGLSVRELPVSWREPEGRVSKVTLSDEIVMIFRLVSFLLSN
ncbi:MAG: hypothetical protein QGH14_04240, partial [Candidatus Bathyarchaeota archaeon]|nr:hypothetical protein [Candidatus Bathyarchaeota archaeon]